MLGGPGSGKGTVCSKLVSEYGLKHLSAGDLLREEVKERPESELSVQIEEHIKNGSLVPANVIVPLLKQKIDSTEASGYLVDGFPRETSQAELFESEIAAPAHVLYLECSEETMLNRLLKRAETSGRVDDNEETIRKRFTTFQNQSVPVVDHYDAMGLVSKIDGNTSPEEAYAEVKSAMDKVFVTETVVVAEVVAAEVPAEAAAVEAKVETVVAEVEAPVEAKKEEVLVEAEAKKEDVQVESTGDTADTAAAVSAPEASEEVVAEVPVADI